MRRNLQLLAALLLAAAACGGLEPEPQDEPAGAVPPPVEADAPGPLDDGLSTAERALLRGYEAALRSPGVRRASLQHLLRQIRHNPPLAFIDGDWATPVDLGALFREPDVVAALRPLLSQGEHANLLDGPDRPRQLVGIAFTAHPLRGPLELPFVGEFARAALIEPARVGVDVVPIRDVDWAVVEYLPPDVAPPGTEPVCYFFCGDPRDWDGDGDGVPNVDDDDDDDDGVPDATDAYPFWPQQHDSGPDAGAYIGLTTKFSGEITRAVLTARRRLARPGEAAPPVVLGRVPGTDREVRFVVPAAPSPSPPVAPRADDCPDPDDPRVHYVSEDPHDCARLRFRCEPGEMPFSGECGCGCVPAS